MMWKYSIVLPNSSTLQCNRILKCNSSGHYIGMLPRTSPDEVDWDTIPIDRCITPEQRVAYMNAVASRYQVTRNSNTGGYGIRTGTKDILKAPDILPNDAATPNRYWKYKLIYILAAILGIIGFIIQNACR